LNIDIPSNVSPVILDADVEMGRSGFTNTLNSLSPWAAAICVMSATPVNSIIMMYFHAVILH
jgi:hypothetical protein